MLEMGLVQEPAVVQELGLMQEPRQPVLQGSAALVVLNLARTERMV
jgi:hypothetical protein